MLGSELLLGISALLYALTIMGTSFRLYLRAKVRIWWWDDSFAVLATLSMSLFIVGQSIPHFFVGLLNIIVCFKADAC